MTDSIEQHGELELLSIDIDGALEPEPIALRRDLDPDVLQLRAARELPPLLGPLDLEAGAREPFEPRDHFDGGVGIAELVDEGLAHGVGQQRELIGEHVGLGTL